MVKIAIAGGSSNVAQEIIEALVAMRKHEILILSRKDGLFEMATPGVTWVKANYEDVEQLAKVLQGVDTVLSFIVVHTDPGNVAQKTLIDAAVRAGVRRLAPSEWTGSRLEQMEWNGGKGEIREYLAILNNDKKILEYTLFQPGLFLNYFTSPYQSAQHLRPMNPPIDFNSRRALIVEGSEDARITLTTVQDLANIVVRAIEYDGEWPVHGGVSGNELTIMQLIQLGERVRGGPFHVEKLKEDDLRAGVVKASWLPKVDHPAFTPEEAEALAAKLTAGILLGMAAGSLTAGEEWNRLLPDYESTKADEFLGEVWRGKP